MNDEAMTSSQIREVLSALKNMEPGDLLALSVAAAETFLAQMDSATLNGAIIVEALRNLVETVNEIGIKRRGK